MAILFNHNSSVISLTSPHTTLLLMQDLINSIRDEEASDRGIQYPKIADAEGKVDIGDGVVGDITVTLLDSWQIEHAVGSYQALLKGGQVVGGLGGNPIAYVPGVQIKMIQSLAGTIVATGSGVTDQDKNDIINGIWESNLTDYTTNGTYGNELVTNTEDIAASVWGYSTGLDISRRLGLDPSQPLTVGNGKYSTTDLDIDVTDNLNGTYTLSKN